MAIIHAALKRSTGLASRFMTLSLMSGMKQSIDRIPGEKYQKLSAKVEDVLARNPGVAVLKAFVSTLHSCRERTRVQCYAHDDAGRYDLLQIRTSHQR